MLGVCGFLRLGSGGFFRLAPFARACYLDGRRTSEPRKASNPSTQSNTGGNGGPRTNRTGDFEYVEDKLAAGELEGKKFKFADPNRRNLLYAVGEESTPDAPDIWHYSVNKRAFNTRVRKQRRLRNARKTVAAREAEAELAKVHQGRISVAPEKFVEWAKVWRAQAAVLWPHYAKRYCRKLRLYAYSGRQRADAQLFNKLKAFLGDCVLVVGDWAVRKTNARFHEPTPGIGQMRMIAKAGIEVYLCDESYTSKTCPVCLQRSLAPFRQNPRPFRRTTTPMVKRGGLLRCATAACAQGGSPRLWNRDLSSSLNIRFVVNRVRVTGK